MGWRCERNGDSSCAVLEKHLDNRVVASCQRLQECTGISPSLGIEIRATLKKYFDDRFVASWRRLLECTAVGPSLGIDVCTMLEKHLNDRFVAC